MSGYLTLPCSTFLTRFRSLGVLKFYLCAKSSRCGHDALTSGETFRGDGCGALSKEMLWLMEAGYTAAGD